MSHPSKWSLFQDVGGDPWVLPIWTAIHNAGNRGILLDRDENMGNLALHVSTRLYMLPIIIERINLECRELYKIVRNRQNGKYVFTKTQEGRALKVDRDLLFKLLVDIDSFLFESNSCCDLMKEFIKDVYECAGNMLDDKEVNNLIRTLITNNGGNPNWFVELDNHRNFFIHEGAPYIAVDLSNESQYEILIMKENIKVFDDEKKYVRLSQLIQISKGFIQAKGFIQQHLINYINNL